MSKEVSRCPKKSQDAQRGLKMPKDIFKMPKDSLKMPKDSLILPRDSLMLSKTVSSCPKTVSRCPFSRCQNSLKMLKKSEDAQRCLKIFKYSLKISKDFETL
ncbi:hypothetical protein BsWGS_11545 [Bradybaena similaris]